MLNPPVTEQPLAVELSGAGTPVVFLHGLTFDRRAWRPIIDRLGDDVLSVAVDLPGHGESPGPALGFDALVPRLRARLDELGIERPVVVGHSMSGGLAMAYTAEHPVRGVVDVDQPLDVRPYAALVQRLAPALRGDGFAQTFAGVFQASMGLDLLEPDIRAHVLAGQRIDRDVVLASWAELLAEDPDVLQARIDGLAATIDAPVLGIFGRELGAGDRARLARLPNAEWEVWDGHGHFPHLVEPDRFAARLLAFAGVRRS